MSHTNKLDKIVDQVQDLHADAIEDGLDGAAMKLEEAIEALRAVDFAEENEEYASD